jgi:hypothetical protein
MFSQTHLQKRRLRKVVAAPEQRMPGQPEFADTPSAAFAAALCALLGRLDPRRAAPGRRPRLYPRPGALETVSGYLASLADSHAPSTILLMAGGDR